MNKFKAIVLSDSGDFLLENGEVERQEHGVEIEDPYIINEDGKAQEIEAETVFIPYSSLENIQFGDFKHETV